MADNINIDFNDKNEMFFINTAETRFNIYAVNIIEKDLDIIPKSFITTENRKAIREYIKNLFLCCEENDLCDEAFRTIWYNAFCDGFNLAMNIRMAQRNG